MDDSVRSFYRNWKEHYIRDAGNAHYYVWVKSAIRNKRSVSEGQGYGMIIVALMAGYDDSAQNIYDGLFRYYRSHPDKNSSYLMAWAQTRSFKDEDGTSATDGDIDIAYSLLLADAQWGSRGRIDYLGGCRNMLTDIMRREINRKTYSVLLSDAVEEDSRDYFDMRSSDFMPAHFKDFGAASGDGNWKRVVDNNYALFLSLQDRYSKEAGLLPDFIQSIGTGGRPAHAGYLESRFDGYYNYNACRVPWRIATDFILNGDPRAKKLAQKINSWIKTRTMNSPDRISAGYSLAGQDIKSRHFEAPSFMAPLAVSAMVDTAHQVWLDRLWDRITGFGLREFDYYDNSIKMLNMIILSGNYWKP